MSENIVLIACGSFNPPTPMHFRMFVHDSYQKPNVPIVNAKHRCKMISLSLSSDWIQLSDWEIKQDSWSPTVEVLQFHQNHLNSILSDRSKRWLEDKPDWTPSEINSLRGQRVQVKLLCGADLLESFANRNLWTETQLETIFKEYGVVVIARNAINSQKLVFQSDFMFENQNNITIIDNWVPNEISSTLARLHLQRGLSLKYLLNDAVIQYIHERKLYGSNTNSLLKQDSKPKSEKCSNTPQKVFIQIRDGIIDDLDMDVTDASPSKTTKPRRSAHVISAEKRKHSLRDQKTKKRPRIESKHVKDYSSNDSDTN